ncbi:MAG: cobalamin biosynthesis protein [Nitrososphaeraceae archaeon]|jgi:cobalt-precorrin 5A hydrolase
MHWPEVKIYVPQKYYESSNNIQWFEEPTSQIMGKLFKTNGAIICIFSLGAVIRLIAPFLGNKKYDPAVIVIDDKANFVISALSGHLGGANSLTTELSTYFKDSKAVITTAADVNKTIAVDILGRDLGWTIDGLDTVTQVSACMVNEMPIGLYQDSGERNWWPRNGLPRNVRPVSGLDNLKSKEFCAGLIITDMILRYEEISSKSVIYRPKSLVVGIGIHWKTTKETIESAIFEAFRNNCLSIKSIRNLATIENKAQASGLLDFSRSYQIPIEAFDDIQLSEVHVPNPSESVGRFQGTKSVSEAAALLSSKGVLAVPKLKFPPDLTLSVARMDFK